MPLPSEITSITAVYAVSSLYSVDCILVTINHKIPSFDPGIIILYVNEIEVELNSILYIDDSTTTVEIILAREVVSHGYYSDIYLKYTDGPLYSPHIYKCFFAQTNANNIRLTNTSPSIILVDITDDAKSIMLPPVASAVGKIFHIKIIKKGGIWNKYLIISPYLSRGVEITYPNSLHTLLTVNNGEHCMDSSIDGNTTTYMVNTLNYVVSLSSDGTKWNIINVYKGTLSSTQIGSTETLTAIENYDVNVSSTKVELSDTNFSYYKFTPGDTVNDLAVTGVKISSMSNTRVKYISVYNTRSSAYTCNFIFPSFKPVEDYYEGTATTTNSIKYTVSIPAWRTGTLMTTYRNDRYFILGYLTDISGDTSSFNGFSSLDTSITVTSISPTLVFNNTNPIILQMKNIPQNNIARLHIIKHNITNTLSINAYDTDARFAYGEYNTINSISLSIISKNCVWLLVFYDDVNSLHMTIPVLYYAPITYPHATPTLKVGPNAI